MLNNYLLPYYPINTTKVLINLLLLLYKHSSSIILAHWYISILAYWHIGILAYWHINFTPF